MLIEIKHLSKSFKQKEVLKDINLSVEHGSLLLIQGINGCGKSTLLKILSGLMEYDKGEIIFHTTMKIGAFIENPNFIENETALYNMQFLVELNGKFDKDKIKKYFDMFHLDIDNRSMVKKYSIGMRQKLGIIQAIMEDQTLLLFDEPTRGLDKNSMHVFEDLIISLRKDGKTCIICAHDGVSGIPFDKVYTIEEGQLFETTTEQA